VEIRIESRWWNDVRFSVSSLIAFTALTGCLLGWLTHNARVQRETVAAIRAAGGTVGYEGALEDSTWWPPNFLLDNLGIDYFDRVTVIYLTDSRSADSVLPQVGRLHWLRELYLGGSSISDQGLRHLKGLTRVVSLDLSATAISDDGLASVEGFYRLRELNLARTRIGDAGIMHLVKLKDLSKLDVSKTRVSVEGTRALARAQQRVKIRRPD
jgi:hypothetical protein